MKHPVLVTMLDLLVPGPEPVAGANGTDRSEYERFALPHAFKPRLSFVEACVAVFASLVRIFLGSLLFAVWGTYSLKVWFSVPNIFLRVAALLPMLAIFLAGMAAVMIAISAAAKAVLPKQS